jgi:transcriptional regulator with XRE-family HTH domain
MIRRQQISAARALLSVSKGELSEISGVSERTIARFESGEGDITAGKLDQIEEALIARGIAFIDGGVTLESLKRTRAFSSDGA